MGKRGAKAKPTVLKELMGNPGRRPLSKTEVKPDQSAPVCPDWLGEIGQRYWHDVMDAMPSGFIVSIDAHLLSQYCHAWEEFHLSREDVEQNGRTFTTEKGFVGKNPSLEVMNKASDRIRRLSACFGFSPADRVGLEFGDAPEDDDPLAAMWRERAGRN